MRVFIGMETSGQLRRRFQAAGCEVFSADVLPAEDEGFGHVQMDVFAALMVLMARGFWPDVAVFHPTCAYLTNSAAWAFKDPDYERYPGVGYHQKPSPGTLVGAERRAARDNQLLQIRRIFSLPIQKKVIENPVGAISTFIRKPSQIVQPYQFGDDASKATCFWFIGPKGEELSDPRLKIDPAKRVPGRLVSGVERWSNQTDSGQNRLSPGEDRWKDRSRTYDGIADALVEALVPRTERLSRAA